MGSGITFSGLGSGLDTDSIITQLTDIERRPITLIQNRQAGLARQKAVIQQINTGLLALKDKAAGLADESLFNIVKVNTSDSEKVSVSATNEATAGTFNVEVQKLAQARSLSSRSFSTSDESLNLEGEFVVNGTGIDLATSDSLFDIRDRINSAEAGVNAQILTVADGDNRLIITAEEVGGSGFDLRDASASDVLQDLGLTSSVEAVKNSFADGARSDTFLSDTQAIGGLLNLGSPPSGPVHIGGEEISVDLANDSLVDIRDRINNAAISGVTADVVSTDDQGITRYHLEIAGTTDLFDNRGSLETIGILDTTGGLQNEIVAGVESDAFSSTTTAVGSLLGIGDSPTGSVTIGGQTIDFDLAEDSLTDIQTKINDAGIAGVTATVTTASSEESISEFRLRIDGTSDVVDEGNVLEALGVLEGSNSAFESVARALTGNAANQKAGALLHTKGSGFTSDEIDGDTDPVGGLVGSSAAGTVTIDGTQVAIDLGSDSLNDIRDAINAAGISGVSASVNTTGPTSFELEISGTQNVQDDNGVLQAIGVSAAPTTLTSDTRFADIGGASISAGDTISISGTNHNGDQVSGTFTVANTNQKLDTLLSTVEQLFGGSVSASVDTSGRIVLSDDVAGESSLSMTLIANNESGGSLDLGTMSVTTQGAAARSSQLQAGQDAELRINGINVTRSTNTITDAVQGVTLTLRDVTEADTPIEIAVSKDDTSQLRGQLEEFVAEFNSALNLINDQFVFDEATETSGPLAGDSTVLGVQSRLRSAVTSSVDVEGEFNALVFMGITFDRGGQLTIDDELLTSALDNNLADVKKLFIAEGSTSDNKIEFVRSNERSKAGDYDVDVTAAAARAEIIGGLDLSGGLAEDQTVTITEEGGDQISTIQLLAGDDTDDVVAKINAAFDSQVAEVRRASLINTTDSSTAITEATTFAQINGAGVVDGDSIRIQGTTHDGGSVSREFTINDVNMVTVGDLLDDVRATFGNNVSANMDSSGRIFITDNEVGPSGLTLALVEANEGGGSLDFGSLEVEDEGRFQMEITAENKDGTLLLRHDSYGERAGFTVTQSTDQLGIDSTTHIGTDVQGTINGEVADGFGRILTGARENQTTDGLALRVTATSEEVASTSQFGSVNLVYGVGRVLNDTLGFITDSFDGTLKVRGDSIDDTIDNMADQIVAMERRVEQKRLNLVGKFATLEGTLSILQSQGDFLTSQLAGLSR
jgi:flagellar hook-associated protein 2